MVIPITLGGLFTVCYRFYSCHACLRHEIHYETGQNKGDCYQEEMSWELGRNSDLTGPQPLKTRTAFLRESSKCFDKPCGVPNFLAFVTETCNFVARLVNQSKTHKPQKANPNWRFCKVLRPWDSRLTNCQPEGCSRTAQGAESEL